MPQPWIRSTRSARRKCGSSRSAPPSHLFAGVPSGISLPISADPIIVDGVPVATDKLVAALVATLCIAVVGAFYRYSRTGVALQALADDRQTAMSVGIDIDHHLLIVWVLAGVISVAAGVLWTFVSGGGFGAALVGLKVFPIVIVGGLDSILGADRRRDDHRRA